MKAAIVEELGKAPIYSDFETPMSREGEFLVTVSAAPLTPLTKGRASGSHYSSSGRVPFVVGTDGVGHLESGKRVYFILPEAPYGSIAETTVVKSSQCVAIPDNLDDITAAAIANPGMSSWVALKEVARLVPGETVLVNGATGAAGRLAVQIAKFFGARKVIATGRNKDALKTLGALGADEVIALANDADATEAAFKEHLAGGVDVVIDYLWGPSAEGLLTARTKVGNSSAPFRFVQVGSASGQNISLPGAVLRSTAIVLIGSGLGRVPIETFVSAIGALLQSTTKAGFQIAARTVAFTAVESEWSNNSSEERTVFVIGSEAP